MSKTRTVRFHDRLDTMVDSYIHKNGLKFNQLVNLAVEKYISGKNTIELEPVGMDEWDGAVNKTLKKHKKTIDDLK